ncbi:hypothetical protein QQ045_000021 [Rhodiola kirilowii]
MNVFRLAGDITHLISILILLLKIYATKSCSGISLRTQELYALVFVTRYLDLVTDFISVPILDPPLNTVMNIVFISSSLAIVWCMRSHKDKVVKRSYDKELDTFRLVCWAFSIYLEAVAILPQLVLLQRSGNVDNLTGQYVFFLGAYRALYILNWIYRYYTEKYFTRWIWFLILCRRLRLGFFDPIFDGCKMASGSAVAQAEGKGKEKEGTGVTEQNKSLWATRVAGSRNRERGAPLLHLPQEQGADRVVIPEEEWKATTSKFEHALVGFVFGSKPFLGRMRGIARVKWGDESAVKISQLNKGIFLFKFVSEVKKAEVMLGTPICTDGVTAEGSSYNYARVCVQIYADQEFMDHIEYEDPYGNCYVQPVEYEWKPPRCHNCCNFGHLMLSRGPDGFSSSFFKSNWRILGKELCEAVRHCLRHNALPKGVNAAYIALIPKSGQACKPEDYRHISCCNVSYKIVSSLLASRLKEVLLDIINSAQGAFVKDRSIVGKICLVQQLLNGYSRRNISERMAWQIDLQKAYDTIDWNFLTSMLENLKFPSKFIAWLVMCVQSTSYSIMINGEMFDFFEGKRGLRQGDPLE